MQHADVDLRQLEFLVLLGVVGNLVLQDWLPHSVRCRVPPLAGELKRVVHAAEVPRAARVAADDRVGEHGIPSPLERTAQLHLIGETGDSGATAVAEESRMAEALLKLRPVGEDARFDVQGAVDGRKRRQHDAEDDQRGHRDKPALPEIPARVAGELYVRALRVGDRARVVGPQQERKRQHEHRERVTVLVLRHVEEVGREGCCAGDQAQHGFTPAEHAPGKPTAGDPHQQTDEEQVERCLLRRTAVVDALPPGTYQRRTDHVGRMTEVHLRPRSDERNDRRQSEADPECDRLAHRQHRKGPHQQGRDNRDDVHHVDARYPLDRRRRARDRQCQEKDQQGGPQPAASHGVACAPPDQAAPVQRALESRLRTGQPALRRYVSHPLSSRGARSRRPCAPRTGRRPGRGRSSGSGRARRSWPRPGRTQ